MRHLIRLVLAAVAGGPGAVHGLSASSHLSGHLDARLAAAASPSSAGRAADELVVAGTSGAARAGAANAQDPVAAGGLVIAGGVASQAPAGGVPEPVAAETYVLVPTLPPVEGLDGTSNQHIDMLNRATFWWSMAGLNTVVGIGMVLLERSHRSPESSTSPDAEEAPRWFLFWHAAHLAYCVVAINVAMLVWGIGQEYVTTNLYGPDVGSKEKIPSTLFIVFCNRLLTTAVCAAITKAGGRALYFQGLFRASLPAISNLLASWCQYSSLLYVPFTLQTVAKTGKLVPVVLIAALRGKRQSLQDWVEFFVIALCLVTFGLEVETQQDGAEVHGAAVGMLLLVGLVAFDSLTPHLQDLAFEAEKHLDAVQLTCGMAAFACLASLSVLSFTGELVRSLAFVRANPEVILHIFVLSLSSCLTQFLVSYTIKHFGPVTLTLIVTTRQAISVCLSAAFFHHTITVLAWAAALLVFATVVIRALRHVATFTAIDSVPELLRQLSTTTASNDAAPGGAAIGRRTVVGSLRRLGPQAGVCLCAVAIHVVFGCYALTQEFLTSHTFAGRIFSYPMFLIAVNRVAGVLFSFLLLQLHRLPAVPTTFWWSALPALTNVLASVPQYEVLYMVLFPVQTLLKSLKVLPVMVCGRVLRNRSYSWLDYMEGLAITVLVGIFVWDFQVMPSMQEASHAEGATTGTALSIGLAVTLMALYSVMDAMTSNLQDYVFQRTKMEPVQQMFGMELLEGLVVCLLISVTGELGAALSFLRGAPEAWSYVALLAVTYACGVYVCIVTVRLFGPAILTLLMVSRQLLSLIMSMVFFHHSMSPPAALSFAAIALITLGASFRRVTAATALESGPAAAATLDARLPPTPAMAWAAGFGVPVGRLQRPPAKEKAPG